MSLLPQRRTCSCFPRMHRERAELEQNFAREIGNLVHKLSAEKDQLEAELKLKMDQEVMVVRWVMTSQRVSVQGGDIYSYRCSFSTLHLLELKKTDCL